jgi:hypothetical protein
MWEVPGPIVDMRNFSCTKKALLPISTSLYNSFTQKLRGFQALWRIWEIPGPMVDVGNSSCMRFGCTKKIGDSWLYALGVSRLSCDCGGCLTLQLNLRDLVVRRTWEVPGPTQKVESS